MGDLPGLSLLVSPLLLLHALIAVAVAASGPCGSPRELMILPRDLGCRLYCEKREGVRSLENLTALGGVISPLAVNSPLTCVKRVVRKQRTVRARDLTCLQQS